MKIDLSSTPSLNTGNNICRALRRFKILFCLALAVAVAPAQTKPMFEVASIKPAPPLDLAKLRAGIQNGEMPRLGPRVDGARAEYLYMTVADLIVLAYNVKSYQITGPGWIGTQPFDIIAKLPEGASKNDVPKMLQALLEDRFKMALHRESKEHPMLALVVGKGGSKMKESPENPQPIDPGAPLAPGEKKMDGPDGPIRMTAGKDGSFTMNMGAKGAVSYRMDAATQSMRIGATQLTMEGFTNLLTVLLKAFGGGGQRVKDMTGLTGNYQLAISFSLADMRSDVRSVLQEKGMMPNLPDGAAGAAMPADAASDPGGSSSLSKSIESIGLKLESRKVMVEQLVIDHIEKTPTEN
jgi:uncharacterized protein (TIGR03435 family)